MYRPEWVQPLRLQVLHLLLGAVSDQHGIQRLVQRLRSRGPGPNCLVHSWSACHLCFGLLWWDHAGTQ